MGMIKRYRLEGTNELVTKFSEYELVSIINILEFEQELLSSQKIIGDILDHYNMWDKTDKMPSLDYTERFGIDDFTQTK